LASSPGFGFFRFNCTTKGPFSVLEITKTSLRDRVKDDFLGDYIVGYIEKEFDKKVLVDMIFDDFSKMTE